MRVTPLTHLVATFFVKVKIMKSATTKEVLPESSKRANVRCIECGWKYNFQATSQCPICASDKTYLLSNGSFLASAATISIIVAAFCALIVLAYKTITG